MRRVLHWRFDIVLLRLFPLRHGMNHVKSDGLTEWLLHRGAGSSTEFSSSCHFYPRQRFRGFLCSDWDMDDEAALLTAIDIPEINADDLEMLALKGDTETLNEIDQSTVQVLFFHNSTAHWRHCRVGAGHNESIWHHVILTSPLGLIGEGIESHYKVQNLYSTVTVTCCIYQLSLSFFQKLHRGGMQQMSPVSVKSQPCQSTAVFWIRHPTATIHRHWPTSSKPHQPQAQHCPVRWNKLRTGFYLWEADCLVAEHKKRICKKNRYGTFKSFASSLNFYQDSRLRFGFYFRFNTWKMLIFAF